MEKERLKDLYHAQPFKPFDLCMNDGRRLRVEHPEWIAIPPKGRTTVVFARDGGMAFVDLPLVESVEIGA